MKNDTRGEVTYRFVVVVFSACRKNKCLFFFFFFLLFFFFRTLAVILVSEFIFVMINALSVLGNIGQKEFKPSEDLY